MPLCYVRSRLAPVRAALGPKASFKDLCAAGWARRINLCAYGFYKTPVGGKYDWKLKASTATPRDR